jgi:flagellar basal body rod protein FlgB
MMSFFNFNRKNKQTTDLISETPLTQRLQTFLDKLHVRAEEMHAEVQVAAQSVADADTDPFKRSFLQFKSGMIAQFNAILQKGSTIYQGEVLPKASPMELMTLSQMFNDWHVAVLNMMTSAFDHVVERDLEREYIETMEEYNRYKDRFHCKQCGGKLEIDSFYFTATYIACPYCRTQNTFDPGTKVRMIEHLARPLAEHRCKTLYDRYQEHRDQFGAKSAFDSYREYVYAFISEMDRILPGLEAQHQNFRDRLLRDYERFE